MIMIIPDAAIEAAAEAMYVSFVKTTQPASRPSWSTLFEWAREDWRTDTRAAIEAAMPAIREAIAQEIEANDFSFDSGGDCGVAARIVRGGAA